MEKHIMGTNKSSFNPTAEELTKNKKEEKTEVANDADHRLVPSINSIVLNNATAPKDI